MSAAEGIHYSEVIKEIDTDMKTLGKVKIQAENTKSNRYSRTSQGSGRNLNPAYFLSFSLHCVFVSPFLAISLA